MSVPSVKDVYTAPYTQKQNYFKGTAHSPGQHRRSCFFISNRNTQTIRSIQTLFDHGRLGANGFPFHPTHLIRGSSTVPELRLIKIRFTLILKILSNWLLPVSAMPLLQHLVDWRWMSRKMAHKIPLSLRLITTNYLPILIKRIK